MYTKKNLAALLTTLMIVSTLTGCGGSASTENAGSNESQTTGEVTDNGEDPVVHFDEEPYEATFMYWAANDPRNLDAVEEAFNKLTLEQLNMKVDLQPITLGTYMQQIQMILSSDDKLDVFPIFGDTAGTHIASDYLVDLSPYLDNVASGLVEAVGEEDVMCCKIGDFVWGVPTMHERSNPAGYIMRTDILEETGYTADDIKTLDDMTKVLAKVKELYPDMMGFSSVNNMIQPMTDSSFDPLGGSNFGGLLNNGQELTVSNWYESDQFRAVVDVYYEWAQKGYSSADLATNSDSGESLMRAGNLFCFNGYWKPNLKQEKDAATGHDTTTVYVTEPSCNTTATNALGYAIASNSENPDKAAILLNWMFTSKEANDLINWGIEGIDYVVTEDGTIDYPKGVTSESVGYHQDFGWAQPNQYLSYVWKGTDSDIWEQYQEVRDSAIVSKAYGFSFDSTTVVDEIAALTAVQDQYLITIAAGAVEPDAAIQEFNKALYTAGLQTVIDEKQRQFDEWYAGQQ